MRVLLISPFFEDPQYPLYLPSENLGLSYIASYLRKFKIDVDILDLNMVGVPAKDLLSKIPKYSYNLIGIASSFQLLINEVRQIATIIKKEFNSVHITIGGHFATFRHEQILCADNNIDSVVRGDGEETLLELVLALLQNKNLTNIKGLSFRDSLNRIIVNQPRIFSKKLDSLPWPSRDTLSYLQNLGHFCPTQISSSRGCYGNCSFCDIYAFYGKKWRARNAIYVVDEIEWLNKEFGSQLFRFTDDEFIGPYQHGPKRAVIIAKEIIRRKLNVQLMIDARAHSVHEDLFQLLKEAGVIDCLVGLESGVERILKLYGKGMKIKHNLKAIEVLKKVGINLNLAFIMFDYRMTFSELVKNYHFLKSNDIITTDSLKSWLWPLFGTLLVDQLERQGLIIKTSLGNIVCKYLDKDVEKVFKVISKCTKITFPIEQIIFNARKFGQLSTVNLDNILEKNKSLWINIFETALNNPYWNNFDWVKTQVALILKSRRKYYEKK